ncbi:MAG: hypothetical protein KBT27_01925 [Prevotellaceae bacterium]|nr:hypothetical protein [Candidatus Faecinaster equi]
MKTKEELAQLKEEYDALTTKLKELSADEIELVTGGMRTGGDIYIGSGRNLDDTEPGKDHYENIIL